MTSATYPLCGAVLALLLVSTPALAGKLGDTRDRTGYDSNDESSSDSSSSDDCGLVLALFTRCDEAPGDEPAATEPTPAEDAAAAATQAAERQRLALAGKRFFLAYPYAEHPGTLTRERLPQERLVATDCAPRDTECRERHRVVTCLDDTCYALEPEQPDLPHPPVPRLQSGRAELFTDYGRDQDGLSRTTLGLTLLSNRQVGLESRFTYWHEVLDGGGTDGLWLGDVNLLLQPLTHPAIQSSFGIGSRVAFDTNGGTAGVNGTWLTEVFPLQPFVLRFEGDLGMLGPALVLEAQASAGLVWRSAELYGGYDHLLVDDVRYSSWFAGVRLHL